MILIDFLLSLTEKAKKRLASLTVTNKSLLYAFTLNEEDTQWATSTRSAIRDGLESRDDGRQYCRMVETVLSRDKNWVRWKVESCPSIVRGPVNTQEELQARKAVARATQPRRIPENAQSNIDLAFLEEGTCGGLDALKDPSRYTIPSLEQLVDQIKMEKLDAEMAMTDEEKAQIDTAIMNAKWRALRQARAANLALLDKVESTKDLEDILSASEPVNEIEAAEPSVEDTLGSADSAPEDPTAATGTVAEPEHLPSGGEEDKVMEGSEAS